MTPGYSIRARLLLGAALVLIAFVAAAGLAVQRAHADTVRIAHYSRLQATIYLLLARAELDAHGALQMPQEFAEPRLTLPASGLYAGIYNVRMKALWRSNSSLAVNPPVRTAGIEPGQWVQELLDDGTRSYLAVSYGVNWATGREAAPLILTALEDAAEFDREVAVFARTLWTWLGGAALLLLVAQVVLLEWALRPLRRVAGEIARIENGTQERIEGRYPSEISGLTDGLNALVQQERVRQDRYKEALSFLAHSLKTPLAVLRNALREPNELEPAVRQQVARMDEIVQHQLARARAGGASRFSPPVAIAPVLGRVRDALMKVHADKGLAIDVHCAPDLACRIDEGDLFEIAGNLMDNAAKWARSRVTASATRTSTGLFVLQIDDDGPGFTDTESIVRMHVRMDERVPGHGVGLAVVNDIVASYMGRLQLGRNDADGARVCIELTLS